jgi:hypothetical protein
MLQPLIQVSHGSKNSQTSPYCSLGIIFMSLGIAKVHEEPVTKELGDMPIKPCDDLGADLLVLTDDFPVVFRVELGGEFRGVHEVTKHYRKLSTFSFWYM